MKLKHTLVVFAATVFLSSCTVMTDTVTNNEIGTKVGQKEAWLGPNMEMGYKDAADDARITRIGTSQKRVVYVGSFQKHFIQVTGE